MNKISAIWKPAWYELDQSVKCGERDEFWLVNDSINPIRFHTGLDDKVFLEMVHGEIMSIKHKYLGDITEIDTHGLSYKIYLAAGQMIQVESEETPGLIETDCSTFKDEFNKDEFCFEVTIALD